MKNRNTYGQKGFTLIEQMIIVSIMLILVPTLYRFYHETLRKGMHHSREATTIRDVRILYDYLEKDLASSTAIIKQRGGYRTDPATLVISTLAPDTRFMLLEKQGEAGRFRPEGKYIVTVIYRLDEAGQIIREVLADGKESTRIAFLDEVEKLEFVFDTEETSSASLVRISITRAHNIYDLWEIGPIVRTFSAGIAR